MGEALINVIVKVKGLLPEIRWSYVTKLPNEIGAALDAAYIIIPMEFQVVGYSMSGRSLAFGKDGDTATEIILECEYK